MATISIIIPIHNRLEVTKKGLASLNKALDRYFNTGDSSFSFEITVVDDGSVDGSFEWITKNLPQIHLIKGDGNLWWTGAVDLGARYAVLERKASHIMLWNDDLECEQDYFVSLTKLLKEREDLKSALIVSKVLWADKRDTLFNFGCFFDEKTGEKTLLGANQVDGDSFASITRVDWSGGMGTLIPSEALLKINFFDPINFPQYHGDSDMFLRAKKHGFNTYAIPSLRIYNNRETTGVKKIRKFQDLLPFFNSNRSNYNLSQNIKFTQRHCSSGVAWFYLAKTYLKVLYVSVRSASSKATS
jgi:GT2 family glycosyltransferase